MGEALPPTPHDFPVRCPVCAALSNPLGAGQRFSPKPLILPYNTPISLCAGPPADLVRHRRLGSLFSEMRAIGAIRRGQAFGKCIGF
jgi:hypothetical protein